MRAVCLSSPRNAKQLDLATVGANARRATEDSTAVAYLEAGDPLVSRFTQPILETAQIPWIADSSGAAAMEKLLKLLDAASSGSLRQQLRDTLGQA